MYCFPAVEQEWRRDKSAIPARSSKGQNKEFAFDGKR